MSEKMKKIYSKIMLAMGLVSGVTSCGGSSEKSNVDGLFRYKSQLFDVSFEVPTAGFPVDRFQLEVTEYDWNKKVIGVEMYNMPIGSHVSTEQFTPGFYSFKGRFQSGEAVFSSDNCVSLWGNSVLSSIPEIIYVGDSFEPIKPQLSVCTDRAISARFGDSQKQSANVKIYTKKLAGDKLLYKPERSIDSITFSNSTNEIVVTSIDLIGSLGPKDLAPLIATLQGNSKVFVKGIGIRSAVSFARYETSYINIDPDSPRNVDLRGSYGSLNVTNVYPYIQFQGGDRPYEPVQM